MDFEGMEDLSVTGWRQFITDCDGPVAKNDNAYELSVEYIEGGDHFFKVISKYDDILADVFHRPGYKAGDTLRLILPFLKAYGATDSGILDFSRKNILTVPGAKKTMRFVQEFLSSFMLSASYEHYITALSEAIDFPLENVYCTTLELDSVKIDHAERETLKNIAQEIVSLPMMSIPEDATVLSDFSAADQRSLLRLDQIFWEEMTDLASYQLILEVNPIGGEEKASSVLDIRRRTGIGLEDTMYVGDSITDVQAFQLVREGGGLTVAFNGNQYAVREAEIAVISENTVVTSVLAEAFHKAGMEGIWSLVDDWSLQGIKKTGFVHDYLIREFEKVYGEGMPALERITPKNMKRLAADGSEMKRALKGEEVSTLD